MARPWDCRACSCSDPLTRHTHIYLVKNVYRCFVFWHLHVCIFCLCKKGYIHASKYVQLCVSHSHVLTRQTLTLSKQFVEVLACVYASVFSSLQCIHAYVCIIICDVYSIHVYMASKVCSKVRPSNSPGRASNALSQQLHQLSILVCP